MAVILTATLIHYSTTAHHKISSAAPSLGVRAVLVKEKDNVWRKVANASRALTERERCYAQVERGRQSL